jgi:hypothetical protein
VQVLLEQGQPAGQVDFGSYGFAGRFAVQDLPAVGEGLDEDEDEAAAGVDEGDGSFTSPGPGGRASVRVSVTSMRRLPGWIIDTATP